MWLHLVPVVMVIFFVVPSAKDTFSPKLVKRKIEKLLEIEELEIAKEYESSFKILTQVFDEIVLVLGESKVTFEKYAEILKIGLRNSDLLPYTFHYCFWVIFC